MFCNVDKLEETDNIIKFVDYVDCPIEFRCIVDNTFSRFSIIGGSKPGYPIVYNDDNHYLRLKFNEDIPKVIRELSSMISEKVEKKSIINYTISRYKSNNSIFSLPIATNANQFIKEILVHQSDDNISILSEYEFSQLEMYSKYLNHKNPYEEYCNYHGIYIASGKNDLISSFDDDYDSQIYESEEAFLKSLKYAEEVRDRINSCDKVYRPFSFHIKGKSFGHVTLCEINNTSFPIKITIYDSLFGIMNIGTYKTSLNSALDTFVKSYTELFDLPIKPSTSVINLNMQAPYQTDCGRYVTIWLLTVAKGISIEKLQNYSYSFLLEPLLNLAKSDIFGDKNICSSKCIS